MRTRTVDQGAGERATEERRAEDVQRHVGALARHRFDAGDPGRVAEIALELEHVLGEALDRHRVSAQRAPRGLVAPRRTPSPRSMRSGCSSASVPNCSAIVSGEWFGNMMPPAPRRMRSVCAATCAMSTLVADDAMDAML